MPNRIRKLDPKRGSIHSRICCFSRRRSCFTSFERASPPRSCFAFPFVISVFAECGSAVCRIPFAEYIIILSLLIFSLLVYNFAVCRMWRGRLPNSVCRMCPFLKLNLPMRPGSIFERRRLPIVAVLFMTVSFAFVDCGSAVCDCGFYACRRWPSCLRLCFTNVSSPCIQIAELIWLTDRSNVACFLLCLVVDAFLASWGAAPEFLFVSVLCRTKERFDRRLTELCDPRFEARD